MFSFIKGLEANYGYLLTTKLIVLAAWFRSPAFAYAAVLALVVTLGKEVFSSVMDAKVFKNTLPEEAKKRLQDMEARVTSIEVGIQRRGF